MHFVNESPFVSYFIISLFFLSIAFPYCTFFPLTCKYPNNEHENDSANGQRVDFERVIYASELDNEEDMEDDDLPPDLLRLVAQDEK